MTVHLCVENKAARGFGGASWPIEIEPGESKIVHTYLGDIRFRVNKSTLSIRTKNSFDKTKIRFSSLVSEADTPRIRLLELPTEDLTPIVTSEVNPLTNHFMLVSTRWEVDRKV